MAKAVAAALGVELYEVGFADSNGDPIKGTRRLAEFNLCQRLLARQRNAMLMFDEIEDVFESRGTSCGSCSAASDERSAGRGKAWINRTLERNPTPGHLDHQRSRHRSGLPAPLRLLGPLPDPAAGRPPRDRRSATSATSTRRRAGSSASPPTSTRRRRSSRRRPRWRASPRKAGDLAHAREIVEQALDRSATLLDQKRTPPRLASRTRYDLSFVNADIDVARIVARLKVRPFGTFCFYGPAGTGKSELARHIADAIGKPMLVRRASDLLSMWVGGSEKNIARMFADARQQDAVLVLDEADSFLADRRGAQHSWEVTQVNELLTQMEAFDGIFVCTTNLMEALDAGVAAALRVQGQVRLPDCRPALADVPPASSSGWVATLAQAAGWEASVRRLERVTPGDFAVAARQAELWGDRAVGGGAATSNCAGSARRRVGVSRRSGLRRNIWAHQPCPADRRRIRTLKSAALLPPPELPCPPTKTACPKASR